MPRSKNDNPVPTEERPAVPFSPSDLVIPTAICAAVSVLLFLAFQPEPPNETSQTGISIAKQTSASLEKQKRTAEVAKELIRRDDVSFETANSCLTRIAAMQNKDKAAVCLQTILDLPDDISLQTQKRWAALLQQHVSTETIETLVAKSSRHTPTAKRIAWAVAIADSPNRISAIFERAAQDTQHMTDLTQAIPIITDTKISQQCFAEMRKWILNPACLHSDAINSQLILTTIECIAEIEIDKSSKVSAFCELALAGICRADCFRHLQTLGVDAIPSHMQGHVAAALLEHLAIRDRNPQAICSPTTWKFAETLTNVFSGHRRQRFESRLIEIRGEGPSRVASSRL